MGNKELNQHNLWEIMSKSVPSHIDCLSLSGKEIGYHHKEKHPFLTDSLLVNTGLPTFIVLASALRRSLLIYRVLMPNSFYCQYAGLYGGG